MARDNDAAEVLAACRRRAQALVGRGRRFAAVSSTALRTQGRTDRDLVWRAQQPIEPVVTVAGGTAVLTVDVRDDVERGRRVGSFTLRLTRTWVRGEGGWWCLAGDADPTPEES